MKSLLAVLMIVIVSGCSNAPVEGQENINIYENYIVTQSLESQDRITAFRFHGWRPLDDEHLIISTRINQPYLISLHGFCQNLRFAHAINVNNSGMTLQTGFDSIHVIDNLHGEQSLLMKCSIKSIYPVSKEQADELTQLRKQSATK